MEYCMLQRIEVGLHSHIEDTLGRKTALHIAKALNISIGNIRQINVFTIVGLY